jgi:hypothetical protein
MNSHLRSKSALVTGGTDGNRVKWPVPLVIDALLGQTPREAAQAAMRLLVAEDLESVTAALLLKIRKLKRLPPNTYLLDGR